MQTNLAPSSGRVASRLRRPWRGGRTTPLARSMLPLPFPKEAVRDLLGITRAAL